jgi:CRISPR-associated endonuclease/helicase Cas3
VPENYPLIRHLIDTGATAEVLWEKLLTPQQINVMLNGFHGGEDLLKDFIVYASAMHDIGKANSHWQRSTLQLPEGFYNYEGHTLPEYPQDRLRDHSKNSAAYFLTDSIANFSKDTQRSISKIVHAHHGTFSSLLDEQDIIGTTPWLEDQKEIERTVLSVFGFDKDHFSQIEFIKPATALLISGVIILADWIASRSDFILNIENEIDYRIQHKCALEQAIKFLSDYGIKSPEYKDIEWDSLFPFTPNSLQKSVIELLDNKERKSGMLLISAPMGMGKTETSLYAASLMSSRCRGNGFWFALPTQATTNAIFERCHTISANLFKESVPISLMHSNSSLVAALDDFTVKRPVASNEPISNIDDTNDDAAYISEYLTERKMGGFSTISVSTIDQLIVADLRFKHNALRWLAIAGKTLILDEIHDFDEYTFEIIQNCVEWAGHLQIPVIVMSATLSGESQRKLIRKYSGKKIAETLTIPDAGIKPPAWVFSNKDEILLSDTILEPKYPTYDLMVKEVDGWLSSAKEIVSKNTEKTILITCHTVDQAIATRNHLSQYAPTLLHSRMEPMRKNLVIKELLEITGKNGNRKPYILVSTQIVQQSMDIDFDILITPLCPLPDFLQRVGRVARHDRIMDSLPEIHVLIAPETETDALLPYDEWELFLTKKILEEIGSQKIDIKKSLYRFFEKYAIVAETYSDELSRKKSMSEKNLKTYKGKQVVIASPGERTRLDQLTATYTQKSIHADPTRIFPATKQIVVINGKNFFDGSLFPIGIHKEGLREIGLRTFSVSEGNYKRMLENGWKETDIGVSYMVGLERINENSPFMYNENDGLINLLGEKFWH